MIDLRSLRRWSQINLFDDMKRIILFSALFFAVQILSAQDEKLRVAIFDPTSSGTAIDEGTRIAVREIISSTFVNTGRYNIVERSLLQQVMREQKFSNTDDVDDAHATELGRLAGANQVVLSVITMVGGRNMLSIKKIDVQTATVEAQRTKIVPSNDLLTSVEPLALELLGEEVVTPQRGGSRTQSARPQPQQQQAPAPVSSQQAFLTLDGGEVSLYFAGFTGSKRNPTASIFVNGTLVGTGTLNQGFAVSFKEPYVGNHTVKITWDSVVGTKEFSINTTARKRFVFEYVKGGFGFEMRLKN